MAYHSTQYIHVHVFKHSSMYGIWSVWSIRSFNCKPHPDMDATEPRRAQGRPHRGANVLQRDLPLELARVSHVNPFGMETEAS